MAIDYKIRDKKLQHDINRREASKMSAVSSGKTDKYEYLMGEEILPSRRNNRTKFAFSPLPKVFEKQAKMTKEKNK